MIKFENTEVVGWGPTIRGMRNPMNSWEMSDSSKCDNFAKQEYNCGFCDDECANGFCIGPNDLDLMKRLRNAGTDHRKYLRFIEVYVDITAPLYWWKEFCTYRAGVKPGDWGGDPMDIEMNSCSTMHKIAAKEFTLEDFSHEHLIKRNFFTHYNENLDAQDSPFEILRKTVAMLNTMRDAYLDCSADLSQDMDRNKMLRLQAEQKDIWWQMIQLLPSSYNQRRTLKLTYEVLANIYKSRKGHKLDEWREHPQKGYGFCDWIQNLPYSFLITGKDPDVICHVDLANGPDFTGRLKMKFEYVHDGDIIGKAH